MKLFHKETHERNWNTDIIITIIALICAVSVTIYCIWTLNLGFDITDEAYYILMAKHPESVKYYLSAQHWITSGIWQLTGSLMRFRAAGMLLLVLSSSLLAIGAISILSKYSSIKFKKTNIIVIISTSIITALLYASTINLSPCYNLLATVGAYAAAGLILLAPKYSVKWQRLLVFFIAGNALGMEFLNKPSAGIATFGLLTIIIYIFSQSLLDKLINLTATLIGFILFLIIFLTFNTSISDSIDGLNLGLELFRMVQAEPIAIRLMRYFTEFFQSIFQAIVSFKYVMLGFIIYLISKHTISVIFTAIILMYTLIVGDFFVGGFNQYNLMMNSTFIISFLVFLTSWPILKNNNKLKLLIFILILLPYTVAVGTGNSIYTQVIISIAPWGVALAIFATSDFKLKSNKIMVSLLFIGFITTTSTQIITSGLKPYHLYQPLSKQTESVAIGDLGLIKVDIETKKFIDELNKTVIKCNIVQGAPFLGLYNIPGVALALKTIPISSPWINNKVQAEFIIKNEHFNQASLATIAIQMLPDNSYPPLPAQLLNFPSGYHYCGTAIYPFGNQQVQIWQPRKI